MMEKEIVAGSDGYLIIKIEGMSFSNGEDNKNYEYFEVITPNGEHISFSSIIIANEYIEFHKKIQKNIQTNLINKCLSIKFEFINKTANTIGGVDLKDSITKLLERDYKIKILETETEFNKDVIEKFKKWFDELSESQSLSVK